MGARPLPLRCLSQFIPVEENINCLGNEVLCVCFSQLDGDKDFLLLDEVFSFLIAVRLIRDNWKVVIGN